MSIKPKNVKVGKENIFYIHPAYSQHPQLEYQFPFLQFAESTLAVNHLGMILRFLDLCKDRLYRYPKKNESIHNEAENLLENITNKSKMLKNNFYRAVKAAYQELKDNGSISEKRLQSISVNSKKMVRDLRMGVYLLYPYCGMQATNENSETNRIWRNLFTASQHSLLM